MHDNEENINQLEVKLDKVITLNAITLSTVRSNSQLIPQLIKLTNSTVEAGNNFIKAQRFASNKESSLQSSLLN